MKLLTRNLALDPQGRLRRATEQELEAFETLSFIQHRKNGVITERKWQITKTYNSILQATP